MGAVHFSLDDRLVQALQKDLPLNTFVETGTFQGDTIARMLPYFRELHTVEWSAELHAKAIARFRDFPQVHCAHGTSPTWLQALRPRLLGKSVLYWLDAHWCDASGTAGKDSQCPLLDELAAIAPLGEASVVLIDDARLFLCMPPGHHKCEQWPRLRPLLERLLGLSSSHELTVVNDMIMFSPAAAREAVAGYCQAHAWDLLAVMNTVRERQPVFDGLTSQLNAVTAQYADLYRDHQSLLENVRAKNQRIVELDAHCRDMRRPTHVIKALYRRFTRLLGAAAPAASSDERPRRAA